MKISVLLYISLMLCVLRGWGQNDYFSLRVVNEGYQLNSAWEMLYGPDDSLWVTESHAYRVSKIEPHSGNRRIVLDLNSKKNFTTSISKWPQGGLMGMVLHPSMYSEWPSPSMPFVYLAYVYRYNPTPGCDNGSSPCNFTTKIVRYTYDVASGNLLNEIVITESLSGSNDHNSGRLAIGKVDGSDFLFYTIGDMGAGQFNNSSRVNHAQSLHVAEGKVLRFHLSPEGSTSDPDNWIPDDNPFRRDGKATPVWSVGHRNAQGLVFGRNGILYSSEQQDKSDDEINIIEKGRNYGWPLISGYCDGNYSGLTLAGHWVGDEIQNCIDLNAAEPIYTMFTHPHPELIGNSNMAWPTVACSSIDFYEHGVIPNWKNSLLVPGLKSGTLLRLKLSEDGKSVVDSSSVPVARNIGRLRDIAIAPGGLKIYVSCDMNGNYILPNGNTSAGAGPYAGRILELTYTGTVNAIDDRPRDVIERSAEFELFPNPTRELLRVKSVPSSQKPVYYYIYDMSGKLIKTGKSHTDAFEIKTGTLSPGVYVLKIRDKIGIEIFTSRIVIQ